MAATGRDSRLLFGLPSSLTIADLAGAEKVDATHLSEAIQYRTLDRQVWG